MTSAPFAGTAHAAATLTVTSPDLVFTKGQTRIAVSTDQASVSWQAVDAQGLPVASGTATASGGTATVDLTGLDTGHYTLTATAGGTTRTADFGVLPPLAGHETADERFGVGMHFGHYNGDDNKLLRSIKLMGLGQVRADVNWSAIEKTPGVYSWETYPTDQAIPYAASLGLTTVGNSGFKNPNYDYGLTPSSTVGLDAYGKFTAAFVEKYQQHTKEVEVYNEYNSIGFNNGTCGLTADCYLQMLKATHPKVHAKVPDATVVGPALAGLNRDWLNRLYSLGGLNYLDAVSVHHYGYPKPPEEALATLPQIRADLDAAGGQDKPLWLDENGYPTHNDGVTPRVQAMYLPRAEVFAFASGVDRYYWYDVVNDGTDTNNKEHNFGLFRTPTSTVTAWQPKPSVVTQGVLTRQLAGRAFAGRDDAGAADVRSYRFGSGSDTVRTLWTTADTPRTVELSTTVPVTVTDQFGRARTYTPTGGKIQLTLDGRVLYAKGTVTNVKAVTTPVFSVQVPTFTNTAETVQATLVADRTTTGTGLPQQVTFQIDGKAFPMDAVPGQVTRKAVELPAATRSGPREVSGEVTSGTVTLARVSSPTEVQQATVVTLDPRVKTASPLATQLTVTVTNNRDRTTITPSKLEWQVNEGTAYVDLGVAAENFQVAPNSSRSFTVDVEGVKGWNRYWAASHITEDGVRTPVGTWTGWGPVQADGVSTATPLDLATQTTKNYPNGYQGDADLSGTVRPQYTATGMVFRAAVTDNAFYQPSTDPATMYAGDALRFAVTPDHPGRSKQYVEFGASLVNGVPRVHTWQPPPGQQAGTTPGATATVVRDGTVTRYTITVPWASLGLAGKPTSSIGLAAVVTDNDNDGRGRGWVEWGTGITSSLKLSSGLRAVQLTDA
ncbi:hypothetical protein AQ490_05630 [Wenjunlia vitaminophila]|uniref:Carbohydrate-binding domain-containing protein n=1 Tax=Wenjunlia vitaminophila TaxID=76728 RepID=A0A0T6LPK2_WENVI|nr:hypothetical protein AQ490_05630 [Wenjunlia vitaminophila]